MGLFGNKKEGGLMDVIRCDLKDYLVWKWSPDGQPSRKENAIRYGSSLKVKDGEVAVFVYKQKNGQMQDYIVGPYNETIKTANFPVLTSIVGMAFGGSSPFQAEIYFINLQAGIKIPFYVNPVGVTDPRFIDGAIPVGLKGSITFHVQDYERFIHQNGMSAFSLEELKEKVKDDIISRARGILPHIPRDLNLPLVDIASGQDRIEILMKKNLEEQLFEDYGITLKRINLTDIVIDENSDKFKKLQEATFNQTIQGSQNTFNREQRHLDDLQEINAGHYEEALRIQREEAQRAQRLQSEGSNLVAHQIDAQRDVAMKAAESLGQMGSNVSFGGDGGMNPAGMMTGMMMGGAVGGSMANMMGNMMQGLNQQQPPAPPAGSIAQWHISINGQQTGPYTIGQLQQMISNGSINRTTYVWKTGMAAWEQAGNVPETAALFGAVPPPPPPGPQTPPPPPAF